MERQVYAAPFMSSREQSCVSSTGLTQAWVEELPHGPRDSSAIATALTPPATLVHVWCTHCDAG
jgi:hypothetical protein